MKESGDIRLGKLELEILKVVWDRRTATVADVHQALSKSPPLYPPGRGRASRPRAYNTILTMMRKLEAKGYLAHATEDRTFVYHATISQSNVRRGVLADIVERVFDGSAQLVVSGLADYKKLTAKEVKDIRNLLDAHDARKSRKPVG